MGEKYIFFAVAFIFALEIVSASSYDIEFSQIEKTLVIKEKINDIQTKNYVNSEKMNSAGNEIYFIKKIIFQDNYDSAEIKINLEKGMVVKPEEIFPTNYKIETNGQTISIIWNLDSVKKSEAFAIFATLEDTSFNYDFIYWIIGIVILLIIGFLIHKKFPKQKIIKVKVKSKQKPIKEKDEYDFLLDTEKKVIEELKKADRNELWQKQIQNAAGFSKAKISRLIRNLESRGLITKIPFGNTNKIRLK